MTISEKSQEMNSRKEKYQRQNCHIKRELNGNKTVGAFGKNNTIGGE